LKAGKVNSVDYELVHIVSLMNMIYHSIHDVYSSH